MTMLKSCHSITCTIAVLCLGITSSSDAAQRFKWWQSANVKTELELSSMQVGELEQVFQEMRATLLDLSGILRIEEKRLTAAMHEAKDEEWQVTLLIDRVESARSALGKTRLLMLYRMHRILHSDQVDKFHQLSEERRSRRRREQR